jgi:hypothetical protein
MSAVLAEPASAQRWRRAPQNVATTTQVGQANSAGIAQNGQANDVGITQIGAGNTGTIHRTATPTQRASVSSAATTTLPSRKLAT